MLAVPGAPWALAPKLSTFSGGMVDGISAVQTGPGATLFDWMLRSASDWDKDAVMVATPAFVAAAAPAGSH